MLKQSRMDLEISLPIVLISAFAVALAVFLNVGKLHRALTDIEHSRMHFTLTDLRDSVQSQLLHGQGPDRLDRTQLALARETRSNPEIQSISLLDAQGVLVFHTSHPLLTQPAAAPLPSAPTWRGREPDALVAGMRLTSQRDGYDGALELRYGSQAHDQFVTRLWRELGLAALVTVALTGLCVVSGIRRLGRRAFGNLQAMEAALVYQNPNADTDAELRALIHRFERTAEAARTDLDRAHAALQTPMGKP